ncbi:methyl-accepting chemotaxis protein [Colwellia ponticola]|uniref:HAMP domain-containing protein n=1 Tax=Colwellia ponticola TaxID=2304625 RepID=A0A8H2JPJ6_9GAMM|nr:methyl-accepting chemotaxis protein [Colwellia ponticola]TMM45386.1 HAMP domain-containing protein [Colwellia ponticola]
MNTLSIKQRILMLAIAPLIVALLVVMLLVNMQFKELGEEQIKHTQETMMKDKRAALKNYVDISLSAVSGLIEQASGMNDEQKKTEVASYLRSIVFEESKDGYIFVYKYDGETIAHQASPKLEGQNLYNMKDSNGVMVIKGLIDQAKAGGGYIEYMWQKPSKNMEVIKLGYAKSIDKFQWMVGTGFYIDDIEDEIANIRTEIDAGVKKAMYLIGTVGIFLIVLVIFISLYTSARITRPLRDTALALNDISQGEGDLTRRLTIYSEDEVGQVSKGFNLFVEKIQQLVLEIKTGIIDLSSSSKQMDTVVTSTNSNVENQRQETTLAATAVHEMAAATQEIATNAENAATSAQEADTEAMTGQRIVEETITAISSLFDSINGAAEVVNQLSTDTVEIGNVLNVIKAIADQTNLLALNAAIEAARAGEQGRGFAVVADEVRALASRTQQSTEEIQKMIERLQQGANQAVNVMESSRKQGEDTVRMAASASESLITITTSVSTITDMNTQIATAAEEQTTVADEISKNVQQIADIAEDSSQRAVELANTTEELIQLEKRLSQIVDQFKV